MSDYLPPSSPPPVVPGPYQPPSSTPTTVLVLGILSIVLAGMPLVGLILGIIGLQRARGAAVELQSGRIHASQSGMVTAGRICSIVGTCLSGVSTVLICLYFTCIGTVIMGGAASSARHSSQPAPSGYNGR